MVKTLIALYRDTTTAQHVVEALLEAGFSGDDLSLLVKDRRTTTPGETDVSAGEGAGFGALVGALVGIGSALVPGIGPLLGAGPLAIILTAGIGAAAGAVTGGITAGLLDLGLSDEEAAYYVDGLRWGGTIVSLTTKEQWLEWAQRIMERHDPLRIEEREAKWYESSWPGYHHTSQHKILNQPPDAPRQERANDEIDSSTLLNGGTRSYKYN